MIVIYDSKKPAHLRCTVQVKPDSEPIICGCFDIKIETTKDGAPWEELNVSRWGAAKPRREMHKKVGAAIVADLAHGGAAL